MEENRNPNPENQPAFIPEPLPEIKPEPKPQPKFLARGREFLFGGVILLLSILLCNFVFFGGTNLAFGIVAAAAIVCSWLYLKKSGHRFGGYEKALLMHTDGNLAVSELIATYVYKRGLTGVPDQAYATAIGLFNSIINVILLIIANTTSKKFSENSLW